MMTVPTDNVSMFPLSFMDRLWRLEKAAAWTPVIGGKLLTNFQPVPLRILRCLGQQPNANTKSPQNSCADLSGA